MNSKTKKENNQKENEINKDEIKIEEEKKEFELEEDEIKKLAKGLKPKGKIEEEKKEEEEIEEKKVEEEKEEEEEEIEEIKLKEEDMLNKNENEGKHLEIKLKMHVDKEKGAIYKVYEISDNRIAVELKNSIVIFSSQTIVKIYSLKTFQLITEINTEGDNNSIELKNKDIAIVHDRTVHFYKLSGNNYINYLKLEEKKHIYEIYELKNENLILCFHRCLKVYKKEKGEYKFISKFELSETVGTILEIKNNILFVFLHSRSHTYASADYSPYDLQLLDFENKKGFNLDSGDFSRYDDDTVYYGCNIFIKKNKYLFARYAQSFSIFDIEDDDIKKAKCIYKIKGINIIEYFPSSKVCFCDYDADSFIIISRGIYKYDEVVNKIILKEYINNKFEEMIDIIKLKNNNFIIHNKKEILLINN